MRLLYLIMIHSIHSFSIVGNIYKCCFSVPFMKTQQCIRITFDNNTQASVELNGFVNKLGSVCYSFDQDELLFELDNNITNVMDKYCLSFNKTDYNKDTDSHTVIIKSSILPFRRTINLKRWKPI